MQQLVVNILFSASTVFLVGISFSLIFSTVRFFHFAHAAIIALGAYSYFILGNWLNVPLPMLVVLALIGSALAGWSLDLIIYRPMRKLGTSPLILLLASLGLYIVIQNGISLFFGDDTKVIYGSSIAFSFDLFDARVTVIQLSMISAAFLILFGKMLILDKSKMGLTLRAVSDSPNLAKVCGISLDRTIGIAFCLGSLLAGLVGLLRAFDVGMTPTMGLPMLLLGVVAVVIGGNGNVLGIAIASTLLAFLQQLAGWQLGTHWEEPIAFILLLAFLLWRPQGIFGKMQQKASV